MAEKIRDVSPDQKFALRISYDQKEDELFAAKNDPGEHRLPDGMFSRAVAEIDLVSLPAKEKVVELFKPDLGMNFGDIILLWSSDSVGSHITTLNSALETLTSTPAEMENS